MDPSRAAAELCTSLKQAAFERALQSDSPGPVYSPVVAGRSASFKFGTAARSSTSKHGEDRVA
jgi:hypothetical protein